jgi:hypothetical protein
MGEWRYSSNILDLYMEVSGELHAPVALPVSFEQEAEWAQEPVWTPWGRETSLAPSGNRKRV